MSNSVNHFLTTCIRKARYTLELEFRSTTDSTLTDPTSPDTEYSVDGGVNWSDCAEEVTTGGSSGLCMITLTGAESDNKSLVVRSKSSNCFVATATIVPYNGPQVSTGTLSAGLSGGGTLGTILPYDITGCWIKTTGGTGGGGTGGASNQARRILTYNTSTGAFTCDSWETTPDNTTTYEIILPEGMTLGMLKAINPITSGGNDVDLKKILGTPLTETSAGYLAAAFKKLFDVATPVLTAASVNQTGDNYARLGAPAGASIAADIAAAKSDTAAILDDTGTNGVVVAAGSKTGYSLTATTGLGNQTADITGSLSGSVGSVTGNVGGNVVGSVGSLATQAKADVNAEVDTAIGDAALASQASVDTIDGIVDAILADTGTDGVVVAAGSKTGYSLASTGLDSIATTAPSGVASNFREMIVALWRRAFGKSTLTATELKTYAADGTTVLTTQSTTDDGTTQTLGESS